MNPIHPLLVVIVLFVLLVHQIISLLLIMDLRLLAPVRLNLLQEPLSQERDENLRTGNNLYDSGGNHRIRMKNDISLESQGIISMRTGAHTSTSNMNYSITAGDNLSLHAYHTASLTVENTFAMFPLYIPEPIALHQVARVGNIVVNAQDGDTKITSKFLEVQLISPSRSLLHYQHLITSLAQPQPSPEMDTCFTSSKHCCTNTDRLHLSTFNTGQYCS